MNQQAYYVQEKKNTVGLLGFIFSLISFFLCGFLNIVPFIMSIVGIANAKKCNGDARGLSIAGLVISIITFIIKIIMLVMFVIPLILIPLIAGDEIDWNDLEFNNITYNYDYY